MFLDIFSLEFVLELQVVRSQEAESSQDEETGPLAEIDFWRQRSRNLSGIHAQIQHTVLFEYLLLFAFYDFCVCMISNLHL